MKRYILFLWGVLGVFLSSYAQNVYTCRYWFDRNHSTSVVESFTDSVWHGNIDVASLTNGLHTLNLQVKDTSNRWNSPRSYMFIKLADTLHSATTAGEPTYICWMDNDYATRQTGLLGNGHLLLDVDTLRNGLHTVNIALKQGNDYTSTRSYMFIKMSGAAFGSDSGNYAYTCWFDQDYASAQTGLLTGGNILLDVESLRNGVHTVNITLNRGGDYSSTRSYMFIKMGSGTDSSARAITYTYWFDDNTSVRRSGELQSGNMMLDVEHLREGVHFLNLTVTTHGTSTTYRHIFYKDFVGVRGIAKYEYWLNGDYANSRRHTVDPVRDTFNLVGLLPVDTLPIRPECFHFHPTDTTPIIYAKNEITFRFWGNDMRFIDTTRYYVDENVRMDVVADTILPNTQESFSPIVENNIKWFKLSAKIGDSLAFKSNIPCTLKLFSPSGGEVYNISSASALKFNGLHTYENGTYYLAIHSSNPNNNNIQIVEYKHYDKYVILEHTPTVMGNTVGVFNLSLTGNGFDKLENAFLVNSSNAWRMDSIVWRTMNLASIRYIIPTGIPNDVYDLLLCFKDYDGTLDTLVLENALSLEKAFFGTIDVDYSYNASTTSPHLITLTVRNNGNVAYQAVPINIVYTNIDKVTLNLYNELAFVEENYINNRNNLTYYVDSLFGRNARGAYIPLLIPELNPYDSRSIVLEINAPTGTSFDFYAWAGVPWSVLTEDALIADSIYCATNPGHFGWNGGGTTGGGTTGDGTTGDGTTGGGTTGGGTTGGGTTGGGTTGGGTTGGGTSGGSCASDVFTPICVDVPDPCEIGGRLGSDLAECACGIMMGNGIMLGNIMNALIHNNRMAQLNAVGVYSYQDAVDQGLDCMWPTQGLQSPGSIFWNAFGHCTGLIPNDLVSYLAERFADHMGDMSEDCVPPGSHTPNIPAPIDPNEITGYIAESGCKYISATVQKVYYEIECENEPLYATAAAHTVIITDTLDSTKFNLTSLASNRITIGNKVLTLNGEQNFIRTLDLRPEVNVIAQIQQIYDTNFGIIKWIVTSLDPYTMDEVTDYMIGVLPVNTDGKGVATFSYSINLKSIFNDGTQISNKASIVFDEEKPIMTPLWTNIVDAVAPTSSISYGEIDQDSIILCFTSSDNRSGIWKYELHGRVDSISPWQLVSGNIYSQVFSDTVNSLLNDFYVIAIDSAGNRETKNPKAEYNRNTGLTDGNNSVTYQISFVNYDGSLLRTNTFASGIMPRYIGTLPTRTGDVRYTYAFRGWNPQLSTVSANATYTAVFDSIPNIYQITFVDKDSNVLQMDSLAYGATPEYVGTIQSLPPTDSFAYTFAGWNPSITPVSGDAIYMIKYDSMSITDMRYFLVTYNNWDGTELYRDSVLYGYTPTYRGENPTKENEYFSYQFVGWSPTVLPISGNATYTARFDSVAILYNIKFVNANGYVLQENEMQYGSIPAYAGDVPTLRSNNRYSYTFRGWNNVIDTVTANATYTAVYDSVIRDYIVRFVDYNGGILQSDTLHYGDTISYRGVAPQRVSQAPCRYVFTGWSSERQIVEGNLDYIALYDSILFTIQCQTNDTAMGMAYSSAPQYGVPTVTLTAVANAGYRFVSWNDGDTANPRIVTLDSNMMFVATFEQLNDAQVDTIVDVVVACDSYTWINGVTYTESNNTATYRITVNNGDNEGVSDSIPGFEVSANIVTAVDKTTSNSIYNSLRSSSKSSSRDTIMVLNLTINYSTDTTIYDTICANSMYVENGFNTNVAGIYTDTLQTVNGCDSIVRLYLTVNPVYDTVIYDTICSNTMYTANGFNTNVAGTYTDTLQTINGCDSIVRLYLTVNPVYDTAIYDTICSNTMYTANGFNTNVAGTYIDTLQTINGCDSIVTLHLTVNPVYDTAIYDTICSNTMYTANGFNTNVAGTYIDTLQTINGCDSIVRLYLTVNSVYDTVIYDTICSNTMYTANGFNTNVAGTHTDTLQTINGCDSIVTLHLTVNNAVTIIDEQEACGSFTWIDGYTYTSSTNAPTYTITSESGCDSIINLHLTIKIRPIGIDTQTACDAFTWIDGNTYVQSTNIPYYILTASNGCDSVAILNLTINHSSHSIDVRTACDSLTWIDGITYYASTNTPTYTYTNAEGCDSIVTLNLTINNSYHIFDSIVACNNYTWIDGVTYTESTNTPTYTYTTVNGCDSVVTLNLTINNSTTGTDVVTACDSYTWIDGITYTESNNTATYTLTNAVGCDSVVTLNLTINNSTIGSDSVTACDSYTWIDGVTYTESTDSVTYTLTNAMGCDSVVTLILTINHSVYDTIVDTAMNEYTWNGEIYTQTGVYEYVAQTAAGCDSIVVLILTIQNIGVEVPDMLDNLKFYPNPAQSIITFNTEDIVKVEVLDGMGRMVAVFENSYRIDISQLVKGYYTMRITTSKGITIRRVVKQ